jgi:hypothetical protein
MSTQPGNAQITPHKNSKNPRDDGDNSVIFYAVAFLMTLVFLFISERKRIRAEKMLQLEQAKNL